MTVLIRTGSPKRKTETNGRRPRRSWFGQLVGFSNSADLIEQPQSPVPKLSNVPCPYAVG